MCSLSAVAQRNWDIVDSITVDTFLQESNLSYVDVLKVGCQCRKWGEGVDKCVCHAFRRSRTTTNSHEI